MESPEIAFYGVPPPPDPRTHERDKKGRKANRSQLCPQTKTHTLSSEAGKKYHKT